MKAKHQRLTLAIIAAIAVAGSGLLAAGALREEAAYFRTPNEVRQGMAEVGEAMRLGGMVQKGSLQKLPDGVTIRFVATDGKASLPVEFVGITPDLFKEESGMVADGKLRPDGVFEAERILAKHDERYMPPQLGAIPKDAGKSVAEPTA
jgi:cytochrome c-type biogenesis protein CcmE